MIICVTWIRRTPVQDGTFCWSLASVLYRFDCTFVSAVVKHIQDVIILFCKICIKSNLCNGNWQKTALFFFVTMEDEAVKNVNNRATFDRSIFIQLHILSEMHVSSYKCIICNAQLTCLLHTRNGHVKIITTYNFCIASSSNVIHS